MKILAHFELEGLVRQGQDAVWVPLGCFETREAAERAGLQPHNLGSRWGSQIESSRIVPLYRDPTGGYAVISASHVNSTQRRPHFSTRPSTEIASLPA